MKWFRTPFYTNSKISTIFLKRPSQTDQISDIEAAKTSIKQFMENAYIPKGGFSIDTVLFRGNVCLCVELPVFVTGSAFSNAASLLNELPGGVKFSRSSTAFVFNSSGLVSEVGVDVPRFMYDSGGSPLGICIEGSVTNLVSNVAYRDLSNAAWVKTNVTTSDGVGADGTNKTIKATATANNATIGLTLTSASEYHTISALVRRSVGVDPVSWSIDGGVTYREIGGVLTDNTRYYRIHLSKRITNPTILFKIHNSTDAILIDFVQCQSGQYCTSPVAGGATKAPEYLYRDGWGSVDEDVISASNKYLSLLGIKCISSIERVDEHLKVYFVDQVYPLYGIIQVDGTYYTKEL